MKMAGAPESVRAGANDSCDEAGVGGLGWHHVRMPQDVAGTRIAMMLPQRSYGSFVLVFPKVCFPQRSRFFWSDR